MNKILSFFLFLMHSLFAFSASPQWVMSGGAHPDVSLSIEGLSTSSPTIGDSVASYSREYSSKDSKKRAHQLENRVAQILTDGRCLPARNGYEAAEFLGKYEGDSGIDGLFKVWHGDRYFYLCIESEYSTDGNFSFDKDGINVNGNKAEQMSTAWIKVIAHNLAKKVKNENPQSYKDDEAYRAFKEIVDHTSDMVIRALATGDGKGNLNFCLLSGYRNSKFDHKYLRDMFSSKE